MKVLFAILTLLITIFGFAVGTYVALYKTRVKNKAVKALVLAAVGTAATVATFIVCLTAIWPPV